LAWLALLRLEQHYRREAREAAAHDWDFGVAALSPGFLVLVADRVRILAEGVRDARVLDLETPLCAAKSLSDPMGEMSRTGIAEEAALRGVVQLFRLEQACRGTAESLNAFSFRQDVADVVHWLGDWVESSGGPGGTEL
jgi:hypothetical protein